MSKYTPGLLYQSDEAPTVLIAGHPSKHERFVATTDSRNRLHNRLNDAVHQDRANADRIRACWNAMYGIPDPAAFVKAARELAAMDHSGDEMRIAAADRLRAALTS